MKPSASLDSWRNYFRRADSDIFEIIDHAIMVAAIDCPKEFKSRRDRIAELLFSCRISRCTGCDHLELAVRIDDDDNRGRNTGDDHSDGGGDDDYIMLEAGGSKESKVNSSRGDNHIDDVNTNNNGIVSNYSYREAEALDDEIEEASQIVGEVLRIKDILLNSQDESNYVLFESLRRLQLMALTVDTLQATEIGKAVNALRRHRSNRICQLAKSLISEWKDLVDQWVNATNDIAGGQGTPDSASPSMVDDEEGLPFPPLDEGAFFTTEPTGIELSQFFEGMDDDLGNPRNCEQFSKNCENEVKPVTRKPQGPDEAQMVVKDTKRQPMKRQEAPLRPNKPNKPSAAYSTVPRIPLKQSMEQKVKNEVVSAQKPEKSSFQWNSLGVDQKRKVLGGQQDKLKCSDEEAKFEFAKRKLQESYQQHENAKRQRTIQVLETIPKQGPPTQKSQFKKAGFNNRHWANWRR